MNSQNNTEYGFSEILHLVGDETDRRRLSKELWDNICKLTPYLDKSVGLSQRIWHIRNGEYAPVCLKCDSVVKWRQQSKEYRPYCSKVCSRSDPQRIEKSRLGLIKTIAETDVVERRAETNLKKYGSKSFLTTSGARKALKDWSEKNLGVSHPSQSAEIKEKKKQTSLNKFGTEHAAQSPQIKQKTKEYFSQVYGCHPMNLDEIKEKQAQNIKRIYGDHNKRLHIPKEVLDTLNDPNALTKLNETMTMAEIANSLNVSPSYVGKSFKAFGLKYINHGRSILEREIENFFKLYGFKPEISNRKLINPLELDLLIVEKTLAIEVNGSYWHSDNRGIDANYHLTKTTRCIEKGYRLFHIQDYLWHNKRDIIESRLLYALGLSKSIAARKCRLERVDSKIANKFMNENHIQGSCPLSYAAGLYQNDTLVACMTIGKPRFNKNYDWELLRYATIKNHTVIGGPSRLLKYFAKDHNGTMITYADRNYSEGNVYQKMGFDFIKATKPSYSYTKDYKNFHNRVAFQKHKLSNLLEDFDPNETEWENMSRHGWDRVWDCGTNVYTIVL